MNIREKVIVWINKKQRKLDIELKDKRQAEASNLTPSKLNKSVCT